jgi:hypothetical protein
LARQERRFDLIHLDVNFFVHLRIPDCIAKIVVQVGVLSSASPASAYIRGFHSTTCYQLLDLEALWTGKTLGTGAFALVDVYKRGCIAARRSSSKSAFLVGDFFSALDIKVRSK